MTLLMREGVLGGEVSRGKKRNQTAPENDRGWHLPHHHLHIRRTDDERKVFGHPVKGVS